MAEIGEGVKVMRRWLQSKGSSQRQEQSERRGTEIETASCKRQITTDTGR